MACERTPVASALMIGVRSAVCGEERPGGCGDRRAMLLLDVVQERLERAGGGDAGRRHGFVQNADRVDRVAQIFERLEHPANPLRLGPLLRSDGREHRPRQLRGHAAAAGC